ncbi:MAG: glycosyltransferase, partial [Thermoplasmata archaeon]
MKNILLWLYPPHPFVEFALDLLKNRSRLIVSDCVDDHRLYATTAEEKRIVEGRYGKIIRASDVAFSVSKSFLMEMKKYNSRIYYVPNAIPDSLFMQDYEREAPSDLAQIKHPIIGYTGALSMRFDTKIIDFIARARPNWNIVLIGTSPSIEVKRLLNLSNVYWLGPKTYDEIHNYIRNFDVCVIPHTVDTMTEGMNPLKLYEYLALGKPVVSTPIAGIERFSQEVKIAETPEEFVRSIEEAIGSDTQELRERRKERVRCHTWMARVEEMMDLCISALEKRKGSRGAFVSGIDNTLSNQEMKACVPSWAKTILDVNCSDGSFGASLKKDGDYFIVGVEKDAELANQAKFVLDDVIVGQIENIVNSLPTNYFDCIIIEKGIEDIQNLETFLVQISNLLTNNGVLITEIANARHWSVLYPLLGINPENNEGNIQAELDRRHRRFFTRDSIIMFLEKAGYENVKLEPIEVNAEDEFHSTLVRALQEKGFDASYVLNEIDYSQYIVSANKKNLSAQFQVKEFKFSFPDIEAERDLKISVVIPVKNDWECTKICIDSISRYTDIPYEIIVVDNGSTPPLFKNLKSWREKNPKIEIKYLRLNKNKGFAGACNEGIAVASGDYIVFLNNDTIVTPRWLRSLIKPLAGDEKIGIVGPLSNYVYGGQMVKDCPLKFESPDKVDFGKLAAYATKLREENKDRYLRQNYVIGLCMAVKREVIDKIGGFDERFYPGNFEDDDFCIRAQHAGYQTLICCESFVYHFGNRTFIQEALNYEKAIEENERKLMEKWGVLHALTREEIREKALRAEPTPERLLFPLHADSSFIIEWDKKHWKRKFDYYLSHPRVNGVQLIVYPNGEKIESIQERMESHLKERGISDFPEIILF